MGNPRQGQGQGPGQGPLTKYGVQNVESDYMAHVCYNVGKLYIYPTRSGIKAMNNGFRKVPVYVNGRKTAEGRLVPPEAIAGMSEIDIPPYLLCGYRTRKTDSTSKKGKNAAGIVKGIIEREGRQLFGAGAWDCAHSVEMVPENDPRQMNGIDIVCKGPNGMGPTIESKMDMRGGDKDRGGTGNLFLQTQERNYYSQH